MKKQLPVFQLIYNQSAPTSALSLDQTNQLPKMSADKLLSSLWSLEPVPAIPDYFRIVNKSTGTNLTLNNGKVDMSATTAGDEGAIWTKDDIPGTAFCHIVSLQTGQRLSLLGGKLLVSDISGTDAKARWKLVVATDEVKPALPAASKPAPAKPTPRALPDTKKAVNDYINSLDYDPRILLAVEGDGGTVLQEKQAGSTPNRSPGANEVIICTTTNYSMSNNFDEVVIMQPTNGIIYPGSLIYADQFLVRGQPRPLTQLPLAPVRLTVDLPGIGDRGTFTVKNPNNGNVQNQLQKALTYWNDTSAYKEGYINAARSSSNAAFSFSSEQIGLALGVNVKWASGEASAQFSYKSSSTNSVAMMMFRQVFYTVTAEPPANPADAFGAITAAQAMATFGKDTPPAYVQSVSYGRIIMFRIETSEKVDEVKLVASLKYAAGAVDLGVDASADYQKILRSSSITYALLGGNAEVESGIASAQNFNDLESMIKGKNSVYSKSNPGVPIAYTVRFLKDHQIAKMGFTTDYTKENCIHLANIFVRLVHSGAYVAKYQINYNDNGTNQQIETGEKTAGWSQTFYFPGDATNITLKGWAMTGLVWDPWGEIYNLFLQPNQYGKCFNNTGTTLGRSWDNNC